MYIYIYVYIYVYIYICVYIYVYIYMLLGRHVKKIITVNFKNKMKFCNFKINGIEHVYMFLCPDSKRHGGSVERR